MKKYLPIIFSLLILFFPIYQIVYCVSESRIIVWSMILVQIIICFVALMLSFVKRIPYFAKIVVSVIAVVLVFCNCIFFYMMGGNDKFIIFEGDEAVSCFDDIDFVFYGDYEDAEGYCFSHQSLFSKESGTLILEYDENNFVQAEKSLIHNNQFYNEADFDDAVSPVFEYSGFDFLVLKSEKIFPKVIYFIGFNEDDKEIAYVWFNDLNLDEISSFDEILSFSCGWQYIEKYRKDREKTGDGSKPLKK